MSTSLAEFASRDAASAIAAALHTLPNPDPVLKTMGRDISVYRRLLADPDVAAFRGRRRTAVSALGRRLEPPRTYANPSALRACASLVDREQARSLVDQFIDGAFFGYRIAELMWAAEDGLLWPRVRAKPCDWFAFGRGGELRFLRDGEPQGVPVDAEKFIVVGKMRGWENPYGEPDLASCFWPVAFKNGGMRWWMTFAEKYGTPWAVGKLSRTASPDEAGALAEKLASMVRDAVLVIPDDASVELLTPSTAADGKLYENLLMFCRSEIAVALLGSNRTVDVNEAALVALDVEAELAQDDGQMIAAGINQVLRRFCAVNFPGMAPPVFEFLSKPPRGAGRSLRDAALRRAGCPPFTKQYFQRAYNLRDEDLA